MPNKDAGYRTRSSKNESVYGAPILQAIEDAYYMYGLEAAMEKLKAMREHLADYTPGWSDIAAKALAFFKEKRELEQKAAEERERQQNQGYQDPLYGHGVTFIVTQNNVPTSTHTTTIEEQHNEECLQTWGKVENSKFVTPQQNEAF
jgi:hypothetical protein